MPLFYQQDINPTTRLAVWKIEEEEAFFLGAVPLGREISHPHKRLQHLAGRFLLPYLFPDFPYREIEIADTRKPFLPGEQYHFSISHCSKYAAAIVSSTERVGVDIEEITERVQKIQHKFLHPEELAFVHAHPAAEQTRLLTLLWSCKEALFKWWGNGDVDFSETLRISSFELAGSGTIQARFVKDELQVPLSITYRILGGVSLAWVGGSMNDRMIE